MTSLRLTSVALLSLLIASTAEADCIDPYACICGYAPRWYEATVVEAAAASAAPMIRIDVVRGATVATSLEAGDVVEGPVLRTPSFVGQRIIVDADDDGAISPYGDPIAEDADGLVHCAYEADFEASFETARAARGSPDCRKILDDAGFDPPTCNDTVFLGCGCTTAVHRDGSLLGLAGVFLALAALRVLRRR